MSAIKALTTTRQAHPDPEIKRVVGIEKIPNGIEESYYHSKRRIKKTKNIFSHPLEKSIFKTI